MDYPLYPNSDPSTWCTTIKDTARWCADLVTEEPRAKAAGGWRNFPRVVYAQIEHNGSGFGFRGATSSALPLLPTTQWLVSTAR
jgi:hypothetical protein